MKESRRRFFYVEDDSARVGGWVLSVPRDAQGNMVDPRLFTAGRNFDSPIGLSMPIYRSGISQGFSFAALEMPVVMREVGDLIDRVAPGQVQRIPVIVDDQEREFEILNVTRTIKCIDEQRSNITYWTTEDDRPDRVGQYRMIISMQIDPDLVGESDIFRPVGWKIRLIVSERLRGVLEDMSVRGIIFMDV